MKATLFGGKETLKNILDHSDGPKCNDLQETEEAKTLTHRTCDKEAETGVTQFQAKKHLDQPEETESLWS